mgnify:CR=1 FL=1
MKDIHVGLILDGNRRWAKQRKWKPWDGHQEGFEKLKKLLNWIQELKIKEVSLYCFSIQNFGRVEMEKKHLFDIFRQEIDSLLDDERLEKEQIKVRFAGRIHLFPEDMQIKMNELMEKTKRYSNYIINFAMAYGGREEIVDTVNKMVKEGQSITEESLQARMWVPENLDLVIRTGNENRTSNFFVWQASYAELFFLEKMWPDFEKEDLVMILDEFNEKRERRFGK